MAYLLGSADTSAYTIDSVYDQSQFYIWLGSNASGGIAAASSGNVTKLNLLITSWVTTSIKACLYEDNNLLDSVIIPSSVGTGLVQVAFPSTAVVAGTERYRLGFYKADGVDTITLKAKTGTGNESKRRELAGNYTSPTAVLGAGSFIGTDVFYWSMEDAGAAPVTIDDTDADTRVTEARTVRITTPSTLATDANTTIKIDDAGNDAIVPDSVTVVSGLTVDVVFTVPDTYAGLPYDDTGYVIIVSTADGDATSAAVPYLPVTGNGDVILTDVSDTDIESSPALEVPDQIEWTNAAVITIDSEGKVSSTEESTTFEFRVWDHSDSTWGDWAEVVFGSSGGSTGSDSVIEYGLSNYGVAKYGVA